MRQQAVGAALHSHTAVTTARQTDGGHRGSPESAETAAKTGISTTPVIQAAGQSAEKWPQDMRDAKLGRGMRPILFQVSRNFLLSIKSGGVPGSLFGRSNESDVGGSGTLSAKNRSSMASVISLRK